MLVGISFRLVLLLSGSHAIRSAHTHVSVYRCWCGNSSESVAYKCIIETVCRNCVAVIRKRERNYNTNWLTDSLFLYIHKHSAHFITHISINTYTWRICCHCDTHRMNLMWYENRCQQQTLCRLTNFSFLCVFLG